MISKYKQVPSFQTFEKLCKPECVMELMKYVLRIYINLSLSYIPTYVHMWADHGQI